MSAAEVSALGQITIEHATDMFMSCSHDETELRRDFQDRILTFFPVSLCTKSLNYWSRVVCLRSKLCEPRLLIRRRFLKREKEFGTIERGKLGDLVLLEANSLENISHTQRGRRIKWDFQPLEP